MKVHESTASVFDRPALDAVQKFKYRPRVENGVPVAVPGVRSVIAFTLEDDRGEIRVRPEETQP